MSRLPILHGKEIIKALESIGYKQVRQRGSHIRLECEDKNRLQFRNIKLAEV